MIYHDIMTMKARTWPYGTTKTIEVLKVVKARREYLIICGERGGEGFVLYQAEPPEVERGEQGVITFTQGGPLGGYWALTKPTEEKS